MSRRNTAAPAPARRRPRRPRREQPAPAKRLDAAVLDDLAVLEQLDPVDGQPPPLTTAERRIVATMVYALGEHCAATMLRVPAASAVRAAAGVGLRPTTIVAIRRALAGTHDRAPDDARAALARTPSTCAVAPAPRAATPTPTPTPK